MRRSIMPIITCTDKYPPMNTYSDLPKAGTQAPNFTLKTINKKRITLNDYLGKGKKIVINTLPTIEIENCRKCVEGFNKIAASCPDTVFLCVSLDSYYSLSNYSNLYPNVTLLSAAVFQDIGKQYGVRITDGDLEGLLARAVFVTDEHGIILYADLNKELTDEPNYKACIGILQGKAAADNPKSAKESETATALAAASSADSLASKQPPNPASNPPGVSKTVAAFAPYYAVSTASGATSTVAPAACAAPPNASDVTPTAMATASPAVAPAKTAAAAK